MTIIAESTYDVGSIIPVIVGCLTIIAESTYDVDSKVPVSVGKS